MVSVELTKREVTYLVIALRRYREGLLKNVGDEIGDEYDDLLMADHLIQRLQSAESQAPGA